MNDVSDLLQFETLRRLTDDGVAPIVAAVASAALEGGIDKFDPSDAERFIEVAGDFYGLQVIAEVYVSRYSGKFAYLLDMKAALRRFSSLTLPQSKGVLNCMLAEARRNAPKAHSAPCGTAEGNITVPPAFLPLEDGMYKLDEAIYKVQHAVHGSGNQYAKRLEQSEYESADGSGNRPWSFQYAPGALKLLRPEHRMTLDEAKAFGALYGTCCVCGRTLTDEVSIAAGIGPVCAGRI